MFLHCVRLVIISVLDVSSILSNEAVHFLTHRKLFGIRRNHKHHGLQINSVFVSCFLTENRHRSKYVSINCTDFRCLGGSTFLGGRGVQHLSGWNGCVK